MNIVSFGGGTNSAALLIGLYKHKIPIDLITFADTGAEHPHTYQFIEIINQWLAEHGMPQITVVQYVDRYGNRLSLETECLRSHTLPSIVVRRNTNSHRRKSFATTMRLAAKYGSAARKSTAISAMTREK
jgi:hypothetical protein